MPEPLSKVASAQDLETLFRQKNELKIDRIPYLEGVKEQGRELTSYEVKTIEMLMTVQIAEKNGVARLKRAKESLKVETNE